MDVDVVDLIMQDHREVERLFDELRSHPEKRPLLTPVLAGLLTAHSRAEETQVYPVARKEAGEADKIAESQREHAQADQLLEQLVGTDPQAKVFEQRLTKLMEAVKHHVEEEESSVLPQLREQLDDKRRAELGQVFARVRAEHLGDQPGHASKEELLAQARNAGLSGASSMDKKELVDQLRKQS